MFTQLFGYGFFITLEVGVICPVCLPFFDWPHIWIDPIYVVNVVAVVLFCVDTYIGLLSHILAWSYQLFIFGNPTLA